MNGFVPLMRKDFQEQWRTFRLPAMGLVFLIFGLMSPLLAKYAPEIVEQFAGDIEISFPTPTSKDAIDQIIRNLAQTGPIAAILLVMGVIASEKQKGTAALILTKPVTRSAFIVAKFMGLMATLGTGVILGCAAGYLYTAILFEPPPIGGYTLFTLLILLSVTVYAAITFLSSTVLKSPLAAAGVGLAALAITVALAALPGIGALMPVGLYIPARDLALARLSEDVLLLAIVNLIVVALALGVCPRIRSWRRKPPRNNLLTVIWTLSWSN